MRSSRSDRWFAVLLAIMVFAGAVSGTSPVIADTALADPYIDQLAEAADTPTLSWGDCGDGFLCATAAVPLNYHHPNDEQIDLAVIKLPATDPGKRIGTLFVNFGGPGQSGVNRLRDRARWPWLFSDELRSRFDLVSWDPRGVARSATVNCFSSLAKESRFFASAPGLPVDAQREQDIFAWSEEFGERCEQRAGHILEHVSSTNTARDLELLRRAVGDTALDLPRHLVRHSAGSDLCQPVSRSRACDGVGRLVGLRRQCQRARLTRCHGPAGRQAGRRDRDGRDVRAVLERLFGGRSALRVLPGRSQRPSGPCSRRGLAGHLSARSTAAGGPTPRSSPTHWLGRRRIRNWLNCSNSYTTPVPRRRSSSTPLPAANRSLQIRATSRIWPTAKTPTPQSSAVTALCQPIPPCTAERHRRGPVRAGFRPNRRLQHDPVRVLAGPRRRPLHRPLEPAHVRADSGAEHQH